MCTKCQTHLETLTLSHSLNFTEENSYVTVGHRINPRLDALLCSCRYGWHDTIIILGSQIRIRIIVKIRIQICIKVRSRTDTA